MLYVIFDQSHCWPVLTLFTLLSFFIAIILYAFLYHVISNAFEMHYFRPELFPSLLVCGWLLLNLQLFPCNWCMLHLPAFSGLTCLLAKSSSTEFYAMLSLWMASFDFLLAFPFFPSSLSCLWILFHNLSMCRGSGVRIHTSLQVLRQLHVTARRESWIILYHFLPYSLDRVSLWTWSALVRFQRADPSSPLAQH